MAEVDVLVVVYNHISYIEQCLDSILRQETKHKINIIVIDDCSTDGTSDLIRRYAAEHPTRISAYINAANRGRREGIQPQVYSGFERLKAEYIAVIEGDDFWSSKHKIERQVDYLETHRVFAAVTHPATTIRESDPAPVGSFGKHDDKWVHTIADMISMQSFFHISSMLFRNCFGESRPRLYRKIADNFCCEIYINMLFASHGPIRYMPEPMSTYRLHQSGGFSNMTAVEGRVFNIESLLRYNRWFSYRYLKPFSFTIYRLCREMLILSDRGVLPRLNHRMSLRYLTIKAISAAVYDLIDIMPALDPAVMFFGEQRKDRFPRRERMPGYDKAIASMRG